MLSLYRPSFLRSSITLELLDELFTLFEESYLLGSSLVPGGYSTLAWMGVCRPDLGTLTHV